MSCIGKKVKFYHHAGRPTGEFKFECEGTCAGFPCAPIVSPRQTARKRYWRIYCGCPQEIDDEDRPDK